MSAPVLVGFAGVLVAAVATGMLAGRCARQPGIGFIAWTGASLGLTITLAAQSMGFTSGFGPITFRVIQLTALLVVPLWLAWGLVELAVGNDAVRFGTRLISLALTVVASVILATDPLSAEPFGRGWPLTSAHFQPISRSALDVGQGAAVLAALMGVVLVLAGRGSSAPLAAVVPVGLAVLMTAGLRLALPAPAAYPLLSTAAAGLIWFGASRIGGRHGRRGGVRDGDGRYRPDDDFWPDDARRPASGPPPASQYATYGQRTGSPGPGRPGASDRGGRPAPGPQPPQPQPPQARPYGRIQIFTLLDDRAAEFDRLAEETADQVSIGEPDTLVYVIHLVPNAPMQRIFYETYRDRAAFESHENQPYMQRFVAERRSLVLATNVIELRLKYAKVAPLPNPQQALSAGAPVPPPPLLPPQPPRSQPPPGATGRGPQRPPGPAGDPRLQPPPRPQRPDQPRRSEPERSDRPGYDPERYEPRRQDPRPDPRPDPRSDPRQVPSADRRYGG
jgi:quinol monooxygenase YgiN